MMKVWLTPTMSSLVCSGVRPFSGCVIFNCFYSVTNSVYTQCGITILCSPSAGQNWEYPEPDARSFSATQKESNAEINGITEITPEAIAYFSTLVRHPAPVSTKPLTRVPQAVFAVHEGAYFTRELGGIDLSRLYHDVVGVLRMKTQWASETLDFWNQ